MAFNIFGCWYEPGDTGTWLTWFINQHKDFPKFDKRLCFGEQGNTFGEYATDYACEGANWYISDYNLSQKNIETHNALKFKDYKKHLLERQIKHDTKYKNLCYKVLPWHNPLQPFPEEIKKWGLKDKTSIDLVKRILHESNTKAIIFPIVNTHSILFAKRLAFIRPQYTVESALNIYRARQEDEYDRTISILSKYTKVYPIAIDHLLLKTDTKEYFKLLDILEVPELENWKSMRYDYYNKILQPLKKIKDSDLDNRKERANLNEN